MAMASADPTAPSESIQHLHQAFKLAISLVLFYAFALTVNWDVLNYGSLAIVLVSLETRGASLQKGVRRIAGTTVGIAVAYLLLGWFNADRWMMLGAFMVYLTVVSYGIQRSRSPYAWYVAGFMPLVVWADNYPDFSGAFYFGTFRWLQTTTGILIYTIVDCLFWPKRAGDQLRNLQEDFWKTLSRMLEQAFDPDASAGSRENDRSKAAGLIAQADLALQQATLDTLPVRSRLPRLRHLLVISSQTLNAIELLGESVQSCRELGLGDRVSDVADSKERILDRLRWMSDLWSSDGATVSQAVDLSVSRNTFSGTEQIPISQRAALSFLSRQLDSLDQVSRSAVSVVRHDDPADSPGQEVLESIETLQPHGPTKWECFARALFPPLVFLPAYLYWIMTNPQPGVQLPMMSGIFSLMIVMSPMNPIGLVGLMVGSMFVAVLPIYWWVMPALESGEALLMVVFLYAMFFGYLGGSKPPLKTGPMLMFVNMVGISNQQTYSFDGPVTGGLMQILAGFFVAVVYLLYRPIQPERILVQWVERFTRNCAKLAACYRQIGEPLINSTEKSEEVKTGWIGSDVSFEWSRAFRDSASRIREQEARIDYSSIQGVTRPEMQRLCDRVQSSSYRLLAFEESLRRVGEVTGRSSAVVEMIAPAVQKSFDQLGRGVPEESEESSSSEQDRRWNELDRILLQPSSSPGEGPAADQGSEAADLYALVGAANALIESNGATRVAINQIDWRQLAASRF